MWQCPECNIILPAKRLPIHCQCGHVAYDFGDNDLTYISDRKKRCEACQHYNDNRCTYVDLGCKRTYRRFIRNPRKSCPLDYWPKEA